MKIGIIDSGIGGLSVLHQALKYLPNEQFLYYADIKNVPYGEKTKAQVTGFTDHAVSFLVSRGAQAVVIACNTATSAAIDYLRGKYTIPIIGMEPAIKKAIDCYGNKRVLAAATPITVKGEKMKLLMERVDSHHLVDLVPLPKLVRFAEAGCFESEEVLSYLKEQFEGYDLNQYASLVLGCTHFNYFKESFRKILPETIHFVDGNEGTVKQLIHEIESLPESPIVNPEIRYYYSDELVTDLNELKRIENLLERLERQLRQS